MSFLTGFIFFAFIEMIIALVILSMFDMGKRDDEKKPAS